MGNSTLELFKSIFALRMTLNNNCMKLHQLTADIKVMGEKCVGICELHNHLGQYIFCFCLSEKGNGVKCHFIIVYLTFRIN